MMDGMVNQFLFKAVLLSFLSVIFWGLLKEASIVNMLIKGTLTALAVYFTVLIYLSFTRMILKSGGKVNKETEENETT
ncbi:MAG: hypothetical protein IIB39_03435 [Candidatus Marinimicrobia bacterium]|nr:hypothetical protein [Candidatus Neomarinimicrobiota bacterium]